jgi:hypothetical protein
MRNARFGPSIPVSTVVGSALAFMTDDFVMSDLPPWSLAIKRLVLVIQDQQALPLLLADTSFR